MAKSERVVSVQRQLNRAGFAAEVDGVIGSETTRALTHFQAAHGLTADGVDGPKTLSRLYGLYPSINMRAFLAAISHCEGTDRHGDQYGYNVLVGGDLFDSYADHPNKSVYVKAYGIFSTAAGRYQILHRYWEHYREILGLRDFAPASQDVCAIQMIREQEAYSEVEAGRLEEAIRKCRNIWASLPGAGYGQREVQMATVAKAFRSWGGKREGEGTDETST